GDKIFTGVTYVPERFISNLTEEEEADYYLKILRDS
ncbi:unnamed protein product, partial [marine sediment metagenome]